MSAQFVNQNYAKYLAMRIDELIGYKENPIYKQAQTLFDPNNVDYDNYNGNRSRRVNKLKNFKIFLEDHGFTLLGSGSFGAVFEKPGYPWVFKIFHQDDAYMTFLKYAITHQSNPNLPKINGKILKINDSTYAIRMEKLTSFVSGKQQSEDTLILNDVLERYRFRAENKKDESWLNTTYPGIANALRDLMKTDWHLDLHDENIMMRGNVPVLIDPIYDIKGMRESQLNELVGYKSHPIYKKAKAVYNPSTIAKVQARDGRGRRLAQTAKFKEFLLTHGFRSIGAGSFGAVFEKPGYPWLFKIFNQDPAYLAYLKYAIQHQSNPNVPKIKGKILKINDDTYAVRTEKLKTLALLNDSYEFFEALNDFENNPTPDAIEYFQKSYPGVLKILEDLAQGKWPFDLSWDNVMARNRSTPVVTDPLYDPNGMNEAVNEA